MKTKELGATKIPRNITAFLHLRLLKFLEKLNSDKGNRKQKLLESGIIEKRNNKLVDEDD